MFRLLNTKNLSIVGVLIFIIVLAFYIYQNKSLVQKLDILQIQLEQGIEYQEKLEKNIEVLMSDYTLSIEALTDMVNEKESLNKELNKKRLEVKGSKDDKEANPILIHTGEYILDRLREQKANRDN